MRSVRSSKRSSKSPKHAQRGCPDHSRMYRLPCFTLQHTPSRCHPRHPSRCSLAEREVGGGAGAAQAHQRAVVGTGRLRLLRKLVPLCKTSERAGRQAQQKPVGEMRK